MQIWKKRGIINLIFKRCFLKLMSTWTEKNASRKTLIIIHGKPILMYSCLPESVLGFANADTVILPRWRKHRECRSCSCDTYVLRKRYILTQKPRAFDLKGPLYEEFFFYLDQFLIKGVDIHFRLFWSKNEFVLMSKEASATYKVTILDAVFKACKVKVASFWGITPTLFSSHQRDIVIWKPTSRWPPTFQIKPVSFTGTMSETWNGPQKCL